MKFSDFSDFYIKSQILLATEELGYENATPIQEKCIPLASSSEDILAQAPTGTGKTAAFGITVLNNIDLEEKKIQAVILAPTRELTLQITEELKRLSKYMEGIRILPIFGGQNLERQLAGIRKKPHIIVGTTGRVMDHLKRRTLKLDSVKTLVLDEADEMLDMGFRDDINFILEKMMRDVRVLLFSATMPPEIMELSKQYQEHPVFIKTTVEGSELPKIKQYLLNVQEDNKFKALKEIVDGEDYHNVLIFVNTKVRADMLNTKLNDNFYISMALHGDLKQRERDKVMKNFREHKINILVATDVAARGIDVKDIEAIINYDVPLDEEYYVHRIGRTARASAKGISYTFATSRDKRRVHECEDAAGGKMEVLQLEGITYVPRERKNKGFGDDSMRFFMNIGAKDGATEKKVKSFICSNSNIPEESILEIKLKDIYGFAQVKKEYEEDMLSLNGARCFRRKLSIEVAEEKTSQDNNKQSRSNDKSRAKVKNSSKDTIKKTNSKSDKKPKVNKKSKIAKPDKDNKINDKKKDFTVGNKKNSSYEELRHKSIEKPQKNNSNKNKPKIKKLNNQDFNDSKHTIKHSDYEKTVKSSANKKSNKNNKNNTQKITQKVAPKVKKINSKSNKKDDFKNLNDNKKQRFYIG